MSDRYRFDMEGFGMADPLDAMFDQPSGPIPGAAPARKCRRHQWALAGDAMTGQPVRALCLRCGRERDAGVSRRSRNNRNRGNAIERRVAARNGARRTGQYGGKDDVTGGLFAFQVKSRKGSAFPRWMTAELDALRPGIGQREPVLVVVEAFSDRRPARTLYIVDEATWLALHGPEEANDAE